MIGLVIPAHNEEACLDATLEAASRAAADPKLDGEAVLIVVVLDACTDASAAIASRWAVDTLSLDARNVGRARALGAEHLLVLGARWLAFTDADTIVSPDWLSTQLGLGADVVCGSVAVNDWSHHRHHATMVRHRFAETYKDADGHRHIHGANLGLSAEAYRRAGGFPPLACSEDVALVEALTACGARIAWSAAPRVVTSARTQAKARGGFGDHLLGLVQRAELLGRSALQATAGS